MHQQPVTLKAHRAATPSFATHDASVISHSNACSTIWTSIHAAFSHRAKKSQASKTVGLQAYGTSAAMILRQGLSVGGSH
eukprot:5721862-Amphidinium_carterae.1